MVAIFTNRKRPPLSCGELRHRIQIQSATDAPNQFNEQVPAWTTTATVWASVEAMTGDEIYIAQRIAAESTYAIRIRYMPGITTANQIVWNGMTFTVNAVMDPDGRRKDLFILCKAQVG